VRFLKAQGLVEDRQSGSHLTLRHMTRKVTVTVPVHTGTDVGRGLVLRILKDPGFTVGDYLRLR
jgi:predicted RNA binding protein YcfA (HicA-like mRNA interferase family)